MLDTGDVSIANNCYRGFSGLASWQILLQIVVNWNWVKNSGRMCQTSLGSSHRQAAAMPVKCLAPWEDEC